ncbi:MAG: four helix bundle protein [Thermoflexales bacterium]
MQDFKQLTVWQKSHQLALDVYAATMQFPREEMFGLTSQVRRSAVSIPSNIAERRGRSNDGEMRRFMQIALGSAAELEYQLLLAKDLTYITENTLLGLNSQLQEVRKMLIGFIKALK